MAAPTLPMVSVEEYLDNTYEPDREYVDGVLVERNVGTPTHSLLQALLVMHFGQFWKQFGYHVLTEARTVIVPRSRYRIPDVMLLPLPLPKGKVVDTVPWAVVEILSPDDRMHAQLQRFREYQERGVAHIVLLDPEERRAYSFREGALRETSFRNLACPKGEIPFDTDDLFKEFAERLSE